MWLIVLEAVGALALFLFLMWWTMFSGRDKGELIPPPVAERETAPEGSDGRIADQIRQLDR